MVSGQAMVETGLVQEKSSLERVCDAYNDKAMSENWIEPSPGFFGLARTLIDGSDKSAAERNPYLASLELDTAEPTAAMNSIVEDMMSARTGLQIVNAEAEAALNGADLDADELKERVISFESALVTAQKSRRNFILAMERVSAMSTDVSTEEADEALFALNSTIDDARLMADRLAGAYSQISVNSETEIS